MTTLNLIDAAASDLRFETMVFPDGQPHIKIDVDSMKALDRGQPVRILSRISQPADLLLVLLVKNTLDHEEFCRVELHISYLMAARMDRVMQPGEPFTLKVVAAMINQAGFSKVMIFDPHSEVTTALIDRSYAVNNHLYVKDALADYAHSLGQADYTLVAPDAGALKKIYELARYLKANDVIECTKERDLKTGALTNFHTTATGIDGKCCFIIDDICDGGGTFSGTAKMLKAKGAHKVNLVVSHGIFSKGVVLDEVDEIYTTNSFRPVEGVHCLPVTRYI